MSKPARMLAGEVMGVDDRRGAVSRWVMKALEKREREDRGDQLCQNGGLSELWPLASERTSNGSLGEVCPVHYVPVLFKWLNKPSRA